jgi:hypothetical protein
MPVSLYAYTNFTLWVHRFQLMGPPISLYASMDFTKLVQNFTLWCNPQNSVTMFYLWPKNIRSFRRS